MSAMDGDQMEAAHRDEELEMNEFDTNEVGAALTPEQQSRLNDTTGHGQPLWCHAAIFLTIDIDGALDPQRLRRSLEVLHRQHPVLRTRLRKIAAYRGWRQFVEPAESNSMLTVYEGLETPDVVEQQLNTWYRRALSLEQLPAAEAVLVRIGARRWQLVLGAAGYLMDRRGLDILYENLVAHYREENNHPAESANFNEYLEWRAEVVQDEDAPAALHYWRDHLQSEESDHIAAHLPYRRDNGVVTPREMRAEHCIEMPPPALTGALDAWACAQNRPVALVLQAAWWVVLAKISGRTSLLAGWRHDARADYDYFSATPGLFEKTLSLNLRIDDQRTFAQWLNELATQLEAHSARQEYWAPAADAMLPTMGFGSTGETVVRSFEDSIWTPLVVPDAVQELMPAGFELMLEPCFTAAGALRQLRLKYAPQHYSAVAMRRLLEQYIVLLQNVIRNGEQPISDLSVLGDAEKMQLLNLNPALVSFHELPLLPERIAAWAVTRPDALALAGATETLSYAQLEAAVESCAVCLRRAGFGADGTVALALPRSAALVIAVLAAWRVGAAYLPLDAQWPLARKIRILEQAGLDRVLTDAAALAEWRAAGIVAETIDTLRERPANDAGFIKPDTVGDNAAYILFTSGSTGTPKGVVIEHRQLRNYTEAVSRTLQLDRCRHFAFTATVAADLGHTAFYGALYNGATLFIADDEVMQSTQSFAAYLQRHTIDCLKIVPSHLAALLDTEAPILPATIILGGEPVAATLVERILHIRPNCRLYNHYGPTETTVGVMVHPLAHTPAGEQRIPLTQVLPNNHIYVLNENRQLAATGMLGELYVGGEQVCRGYLHSAESINDVFIESPFDKNSPLDKTERLYCTGDLARYRPEGGIQLYGRKDYQVKIRGFRIELAEIEAALTRLREIDEAVVIVDGPDAAATLAFVVLAPGCSAEQLESIREQLHAYLPVVMVPRKLHCVERMPRLATGKIDRRALQAQAQLASEQAYRAPRDALEALLAERMAQLLGLPRLSINDDFFAVGGHSLLVIKLVARIRKLLLCEINPPLVFDHPTVARLADALRAGEATPGKLVRLAQARLHMETLSSQQKADLLARGRLAHSAPNAFEDSIESAEVKS